MRHSIEAVASVVLELGSTRNPNRIHELNEILLEVRQNHTDQRLEYGRLMLGHTDPGVRFFGASLLVLESSDSIKSFTRDDYVGYVQLGIEQSFGPLEMRKLCEAVASAHAQTNGWQDVFTAFLQRCLPALHSTQDATVWESILSRTDPSIIVTALMLIDALSEQTTQVCELDHSGKMQGVRQAWTSMSMQLLSFLWATLPREDLFPRYESPIAVLSRVYVNSDRIEEKFAEQAGQEILSRVTFTMKLDISSQMSSVASLVEAITGKYRISGPVWKEFVDVCSESCLTMMIQARNESHDTLLWACQDVLVSIGFHVLSSGSLDLTIAGSGLRKVLDILTNELGREDEEDEAKHFSGPLLGFWLEYFETGVDDEGDFSSRELVREYTSLAAIKITSGLENPLWREGSLREDAKAALQAAYDFFQLHDTLDRPGCANKTSANSLLLMLSQSNTQISAIARLAAIGSLAEVSWKDQRNEAIIMPLLQQVIDLDPTCMQYTELREAHRYLGSYASILTRHPHMIYPALRSIFRVLSSEDDRLINIACDALISICNRNSRFLEQEVTSLLDEYSNIRSAISLSNGIRSQLIAPFAELAESADQREHSRNNMARIIHFVELDIADFISGSAEGLAGALSILRTIKRIGEATSRGSSKNTAINLDDDSDEDTFGVDEQRSSNKHAAEQLLQQKLTQCISQLLSSPGVAESDEALREICGVFEVQSNNNASAIFSFSPQIHSELLTVCLRKDIASDTALSSFSLVLTARRKNRDADIDNAAYAVLDIVLQYVAHNRQTSGDPESLTSAMELLTRYVGDFPDLVQRAINPIVSVLPQLTTVISAPEILPKDAACDLWIALLADQSGLQNQLTNEHFQDLVERIAAQVAGAALKQNLEKLSAVVCKLVVASPGAQAAFEKAMPATGMRFVKQIFMLRGDRNKTYEVVRGFWEECQRAAIKEAQDEDEDVVEILALF